MLSRLEFIPIPNTRYFNIAFSAPIEIKIPETFFEFMTISFGHFIFDSNPVSVLIASHTDSDAIKDRNDALFTVIAGRIIKESQIPP